MLSISWGQPEVSWPKQALIQLDQELQSAAGLGITVVVASGDNGASDGVDDGENHVDFPASSPWVLACGGTRLIASQGKITSETAWEGTGGGVSEIFLQPSWQSQVKVPTRKDGKTGRGVPDVAACADPTSGYLVLINRTTIEVGGTAAATPLWAGLIALINQGIGHNVGYINPVLYNKLGPAGVLNPITQGSNGPKGKGGYSAGPGWNPCTGWGSPDGTKLLDALRGIPSTQK